MTHSPLTVARACLQAFVDKDREAIESLLDDGFHFTSPLDNALDRRTFMEVCWPHSAAMSGFDEIHGFEQGDHAYLVYEAQTSQGKRFRNSEVYTVRGSKLLATEVYFGWDLPHRVPRGQHSDNDGP
jgi:hypothetical protein